MSEHKVNLTALAKGRNGHSAYGPSSSSMYLHCAGSLIPNLLAPDDAGEDAAYGTVGHMVTETWLTSGKRPVHLVGQVEWVEAGDWGFLIEIDEVMLDYAQQCVDWVEFLPGDHFIEIRVDISRLTPIPNQTGTADFIACRPGRMVVADWKFGKGYMVFARENTQALLYALGAFWQYDAKYHFEEIEIRIGQPRLDHFDVWIISRAQLLEFAKWAKPRMHAAWEINAPRTPGPKQCRWCKVKTTCGAYAKSLSDMLEGVFDDLVERDITPSDVEEFKDHLDLTVIPKVADLMTLSTVHMEQIYAWRPTVDAWFKAMQLELFRRLSRGEKATLWKIVEGRSNRAFRFPNDAGSKLVEYGCPKSKVFVESVVSPAEAEKLLRKSGYRTRQLPELLDGLVYKPKGKPTLAPAADPRPALVDLSDGVFDDLVENCETREIEDM